MSQKKGNKKDKHDIATIALVTAIISLIGQIVDLINWQTEYGGGREISLLEKNTFYMVHCQDIFEISRKAVKTMFGITMDIIQITLDIVMVVLLANLVKKNK